MNAPIPARRNRHPPERFRVVIVRSGSIFGSIPARDRVGAGHDRLVGPGAGRLEAWEHVRGGVDVHGTGLRVAAGHLERRVPHELLHDPRRHAGGIGHRCGLAPQTVEVEVEPGRVPILDAGGFQIAPQQPRALALQEPEDGRAGGDGGHVGLQVGGEIPRESPGRRVAILRVSGLDRDVRHVPVERRRADAGDLAVSEPGRRGQPVAQRPRRASQPHHGWASRRGLDQPMQLIDGEGPPLVPGIFLSTTPRRKGAEIMPPRVASGRVRSRPAGTWP